MKSKTIGYGSKSTIDNNAKALDKFRDNLSDTAKAMENQMQVMQSRIEELNAKGFQDGNFESLHRCFMQNTDGIKQVHQDINRFSEHIEGLSRLIKEYYNVEI